jgi:hypothetical protein
MDKSRIFDRMDRGGSHEMVDEQAEVEKEPDWAFLSNHATVLICIATEPDIRVRDVAARVGITMRAVLRIIDDLEAGGYLTRTREGRRNRYSVHPNRPFRHPVAAHRDVSLLLDLISGTNYSGRAMPAAPSPGPAHP